MHPGAFTIGSRLKQGCGTAETRRSVASG